MVDPLTTIYKYIKTEKMFVLRRITSENRESNECLGNGYSLVTPDQDDFAIIAEPFNFGKDEVVAFIVCNQGSWNIPIYRNSCYYVMTGDGKTFDVLRTRLSY